MDLILYFPYLFRAFDLVGTSIDSVYVTRLIKILLYRLYQKVFGIIV
jgi:hypothetical protein